MRLLAYLLRRNRATVVLAAFLGVVSGLAGSAMVAIIEAALRTDGSRGALGLAFVGVCLGMLVTRIVSDVLLVRQAQGAVFDLRVTLARQIVGAPLEQLERIGLPRLLSTLTDDVSTMSAAIPGLLGFLPQLAIVIGCLVYMAWLAPVLALLTVGMIVAGSATYLIPARFAQRHIDAARTHQDALMSHFTAMTGGIKDLHQHRPKADEFLSRLLAGAAHAVRRSMSTGMSLYVVAERWGHSLFLVAIGVMLFVAPGLWGGIDAAVLSGFTLAILYLANPLEWVVAWSPMISRAGNALDRIHSLGFRLRDQAPGTLQAPLEPFRSLALDGVAYRYQGSDGHAFSVGPLDLTLRAGEIVFLVGANGSGKTTVAKLVTGLYHAQAGEIRINDRPVTDEGRAAYRQWFSAVYADSYLFKHLVGVGSLDTLAASLLDRLQLAHKVSVHESELSTTSLSQGQRRRLMLLVALLEDRPVYVFDEWAADQDPQFRHTFYTELLPALRARGKLVIAITHDDRYFDGADRVLRLEDGRLAIDDMIASRETRRLAREQTSRMPR